VVVFGFLAKIEISMLNYNLGKEDASSFPISFFLRGDLFIF
jgi:hypothetical protein